MFEESNFRDCKCITWKIIFLLNAANTKKKKSPNYCSVWVISLKILIQTSFQLRPFNFHRHSSEATSDEAHWAGAWNLIQ
jgi:hypothetical protein